jgi:hypothetical protein
MTIYQNVNSIKCTIDKAIALQNEQLTIGQIYKTIVL